MPDLYNNDINHAVIIKLDSSKNFISSDHIENSNELVNWLTSKKFTPAIIKENWEKDNQTFLLTNKFLYAQI